MDHYVDIKVVTDSDLELGVGDLLNALFAKLHRALVDVGQGRIGVSFPLAKQSLGSLLRLHGSQAALTQLMAESWLKGLRDYTEVSAILLVPTTDQYRVVQRVQVKSNPERLYRRSVRNGKLTEPQAQERLDQARAVQSQLPFIQMKSNSNAQAFRLFIQQGAVQSAPIIGTFSNYGLSPTTTIPVF
ncbi:type I-F CRISPR-associated endoribonuclease Cas6/Csy4 [Deefgea sp. CFH1-16]|uniref:type I-F CRISPR-associated endoribonuclease Cas6/Csy4 n=1 Tax=Deefgea sp. CFH1-16 TaxID=2675457 RepID=UPI0015F4D633|nr:type I-F CRISPR-associated endoribonuclease Cas6/Csy4 [Deefgea sp. CFH1-16]MBM5575629.1 type I-F CRISPR-associated endoribonuclease Cas6/Csy4 [Deefgea sp. CFH1-16]